MSSLRIKKFAGLLSFYATLLIFLGFMLFPVYWMLTGSVKSFDDLYDPSKLFPLNVDLSSYRAVFSPEFSQQFVNSLVVATGVTILALVVSYPAAYALSRLRFRFSSAFSQLALFSYLFPSTFLIFPMAILINIYGLYNTHVGLILAETVLTVPYAIWLLAGYFKNIPKELDEAALVDGASLLTTLTKIILPLSAPALIAVTMFAFMESWNQYLFVLVLLLERESWTLPVGVASLIISDIVPWGKMFAMSTMYSLPSVIIFFFIEKYMVTGLVRGTELKG